MTTDLHYGVAIPKWYQGYVSKLDGIYFLDALKQQQKTTINFLKQIDPGKWDYAYAPGKWTVKELVLHMIDGERIFAYRALRFSRNDKTELPGFEENDYVPQSNAPARTPESLISEYTVVREATIELFKNFTDEMLFRTGIANGVEFSVILMGAAIAGHELHHIEILKTRYV